MARASSLLFSRVAVQMAVMFCLKGRELYLIRQLRMVLLFGLRKVLVESLVPANGRVENLSAVVVVAVETTSGHSLSFLQTIEYLFLVVEPLRTDLREPT